VRIDGGEADLLVHHGAVTWVSSVAKRVVLGGSAGTLKLDWVGGRIPELTRFVPYSEVPIAR
jgi:hypothetical protein